MATSGLGALLVEEGLLTEADRRTIRRTSGSRGGAFARSVLALGLLDENELSAFLAEHTKWKIAGKDIFKESRKDSWSAIDRPLLERLEVIPLRLEKNTLFVAMLDPLDQDTLRQLEFFTGHEIHPVIATATQLRAGLKKLLKDFTSTPTQLEDFLTNHAAAASRRQKIQDELDGILAGKSAKKKAGAESDTPSPDPSLLDDFKIDDEVDSESKLASDESNELEEAPPAGATAPHPDDDLLEDGGADPFAGLDADYEASGEPAGTNAVVDEDSGDGPGGVDDAVAAAAALSSMGDDPGDLGGIDDLEELDGAFGNAAETGAEDPLDGAVDDALSGLGDEANGDAPSSATKPATKPAPKKAAAPLVGDDSSEDLDLTAFDPDGEGDDLNLDDLLAEDEAPKAQKSAKKPAAVSVEAPAIEELASDDPLSGDLLGDGGDDLLAESPDLNSSGDDRRTDSSDPLSGGGGDLLAASDDPLATEDLLIEDDPLASDPLAATEPLVEAAATADVLDANEPLVMSEELAEDPLAAGNDALLSDDLFSEEMAAETAPLEDPLESDDPLACAMIDEPIVAESGATDDLVADDLAADDLDADDLLAEALPPTDQVAGSDEANLDELLGHDAADVPPPPPPRDDAGSGAEAIPPSAAVATLNRALWALAMAATLKDGLEKVAPALAGAGLGKGLVLTAAAKGDPKPIYAWVLGKDGAPEIKSTNLGGYLSPGLGAAINRQFPGWSRLADNARGDTLKPFQAWTKDGAELLAAAVPTPTGEHIAIIAAWKKESAEDQTLRHAAMDVVRKLAGKVA